MRESQVKIVLPESYRSRRSLAIGGQEGAIYGPTHQSAAEMPVHEGVPQGTVYEFIMTSADSKIYPGIARYAQTFGTPHPGESTQADSNLDGSGRQRSAQSERHARRDA